MKGVFTYATCNLELKYHHWPSLYVRPWNPNINPPQPLPTRLVLRYSGITTSEAWRNSYSFSPSGKLNQALSCKHPVLCCNACFILTAARKDWYHLPILNALDTSSIHIYIYIITINIIIINYYYYHYSYHYYRYCHYYYYFYHTSYIYIYHLSWTWEADMLYTPISTWSTFLHRPSCTQQVHCASRTLIGGLTIWAEPQCSLPSLAFAAVRSRAKKPTTTCADSQSNWVSAVHLVSAVTSWYLLAFLPKSMVF